MPATILQDFVAQLVELLTFNQEVAGPSPAEVTMFHKKKIKKWKS